MAERISWGEDDRQARIERESYYIRKLDECAPPPVLDAALHLTPVGSSARKAPSREFEDYCIARVEQCAEDAEEDDLPDPPCDEDGPPTEDSLAS